MNYHTVPLTFKLSDCKRTLNVDEVVKRRKPEKCYFNAPTE